MSCSNSFAQTHVILLISCITESSILFVPPAYIPFRNNCAKAHNKPMIDGKYKLKSFNINKPTRLHRLQFIVLAIVKGRGIESALFVAMTFFTAANGDANNTIYLKEAV